jgi:hypothetical protein
MKGTRTCAVVLACCAGLAACTAAPAFKPDTSVTAPSVGRPPPPSSVQAAISSEAFTPYADRGQAADDALAPGESYSALSKACLTDAGYPNAPSGFGFGFFLGGGLTNAVPYGRWGYLGTAEAAQYGFAVAPAGFSRAISPGGTLSSAEQKAMQKCFSIVADFANAQMKGSLAGIQTLTNDIQADMQHNPSVKAATRAWSACMAQNGYSVTDPQTAFVKAIQTIGGVMYSHGSGGNVAIAAPAQARVNPGTKPDKARNQAQIAMAVTDADCTESTDLAGIYFAVQAGYEQQLVDLNQQALNEAVAEYRAAYIKELGKLPALLKTASAGPSAGATASARPTSSNG